MDFLNKLTNYRTRIDNFLNTYLPFPEQEPQCLHQAMRYIVLTGGKRFRPILVYLTGELFSIQPELLDTSAAAVELIHNYSLVHDDLPAMDNDDLRRGQATCHVAFDEATAILAGDTLQTLSFQLLVDPSKNTLTDAQRNQLLQTLASAINSQGMAGGQALDLAATNKQITIKELETIHRLKTGALLKACVLMAAICANCTEAKQLVALGHFADCLGLAYQIQDDLFDTECETQLIGKPQGSDAKFNKPTYATLLKKDDAHNLIQTLYIEAKEALNLFGIQAQPLQELATHLQHRKY